MAIRLGRAPSLRQWVAAWAAAATVALAASWSISRRQAADRAAAAGEGGQVSDAESLRGGPQPIYPDQAVAGYPDSESGRPDEGPAGPNSRPDWSGA